MSASRLSFDQSIRCCSFKGRRIAKVVAGNGARQTALALVFSKEGEGYTQQRGD
jgi:hypothetical protein